MSVKAKILFLVSTDLDSKVWITLSEGGLIVIDRKSVAAPLVLSVHSAFIKLYNELVFWSPTEENARTILWAIVELL